MNLAELQKLSVAKIKEQLPELTLEQLRELLAVEEAGVAPRSGVLVVVRAAISVLEADPRAEGEAETLTRDALTWLDPDYTGPLDCGQAAMRRERLG